MNLQDFHSNPEVSAAIAKAVESTLKQIGEDPQREGLKKTPHRVGEALQFLCTGYNEDAEAILRPLGGSKCGKITVRMKKKNGLRGGRTVSGTYALEADALEFAWKCAREILGECGGDAFTRLRCGEENGRGGGVTALERILEKILGERPAESFTQAGWRTKWRAKWRTGVGERASA